MMLIIVLKRVKAKCVETRQHKDKYLEAKKKAKRTVYQPKCKAERKKFEMFCHVMIKNVMCLRLQREWSKVISILLVSSS